MNLVLTTFFFNQISDKNAFWDEISAFVHTKSRTDLFGLNNALQPHKECKSFQCKILWWKFKQWKIRRV